MAPIFTIGLSPLDLAESQALFNPRNDLSVLAALWNAGPRTRRIALSMADDDLRQFQRQHRPASEQEKPNVDH